MWPTYVLKTEKHWSAPAKMKFRAGIGVAPLHLEIANKLKSNYKQITDKLLTNSKGKQNFELLIAIASEAELCQTNYDVKVTFIHAVIW